MEHIACPVCKMSGGIPVPSVGFTREGSNVPTTGSCSLCWGVGHLPLLEAYKEKVAGEGAYQDSLALHYWECDCANGPDIGGNISNYHPATHDFCPQCHLIQDDGKPAVPLLVQTWLAELGAEVDIVWVEQEAEDHDLVPADDESLVQNTLFQSPVDTSHTDVYVLPAETGNILALNDMVVHGADEKRAAFL